MDAYMFKAALFCADCIAEFKSENVKPSHVDEHDESSYDSDEWPKGPYPDGGGEADCPQHCDDCGEFLENPLTSDGYQYVVDTIADDVATLLRAAREGGGRITGGVSLTEWAPFYGVKLTVKSSESDDTEADVPLGGAS